MGCNTYAIKRKKANKTKVFSLNKVLCRFTYNYSNNNLYLLYQNSAIFNFSGHFVFQSKTGLFFVKLSIIRHFQAFLS